MHPLAVPPPPVPSSSTLMTAVTPPTEMGIVTTSPTSTAATTSLSSTMTTGTTVGSTLALDSEPLAPANSPVEVMTMAAAGPRAVGEAGEDKGSSTSLPIPVSKKTVVCVLN